MYELVTKKLDAKLILHILKRQNMNIPELALKCGISREMLYQYLGFRKRTARIGHLKLKSLAMALNVKQQTLVERYDPVEDMNRIIKYQMTRLKRNKPQG